MKKLLIVLAALLVLVGCNGAGNQLETASQEDGRTEEVSNERTIDLMGNDPFELDINEVIVGKWIDDGETVYTLADGELLESKMANAISEHKKHVKELEAEYGVKIEEPDLETYDGQIQLFAKNILRDHPDKEEYIDKLKEANEALKKEDEKLVKQKIEEARKLRTQ